jgi:hypothetical protein
VVRVWTRPRSEGSPGPHKDKRKAMYIFFAILHVFVCLFLMFVVLLQQGKGGEILERIIKNEDGLSI